MMTAAVAAGLSGPLVFGHAIDVTAANLDVDLANAVLGIGGKDDKLSANIPNKLSRKIAPTEWGSDYQYFGIPYLADVNFQASMDDGIPKLTQAIADNGESGIRVVSYSEGTLVAEAVKRRLADTEGSPSPDDIDFLFIASPYLPNGGLFARFPGFTLPGLLPDFGPAQSTVYDSTYVTNEYDTYADFPAYFNPLSIANALLSIRYAHPDPYYDPVDVDNLPPGSVKTTVPNNGAGGTDTYILVYAQHLPLLGPVREVAAILHLTPLTEPVLAALEPVIRLAVDMGYTDRVNANPAAPTPFSFVTPPAKVVEALLGVPGAIQQGVTGAVSSGQQSVQNAPATPFAAPEPAQAPEPTQLRVAAAHDAQPKVADDPAPLAAAEESTTPEPTAERKTESTTSPEPKAEDDPADTQITHPTTTSDGNKSVPTTTVGGGTSTGGSVTPITTETPDTQPDSTKPAATPAASDNAGDTGTAGDKAA
jgi:diacyltrehalose acyltransferase